MPRTKKKGENMEVKEAKKRGRPEKPLKKIPASFEEIVEAVLKPERKEKGKVEC